MKKETFRYILENDHELADIMLEVQQRIRDLGFNGLRAEEMLDFIIYDALVELYDKRIASILCLGYMKEV